MAKSLNDLDKEVKQYGGSTGSNKFEFKKGANKVRILTFPEILATHFFGKGNPSVICVGIEDGCQFHKDDNDRPSLKLVSYVVDREDGKVKLAELPLSVRYGLQDLQNTEGFEFSDFPMPYDVQIFHDPDNNDPKAKYRTTDIPKMIPLTKEEQESFDAEMKRMTPEQYVEKRKAKVRGVDSGYKAPSDQVGTITPKVSYPTEDINPDDIPF